MLSCPPRIGVTPQRAENAGLQLLGSATTDGPGTCIGKVSSCLMLPIVNLNDDRASY